MDKGGGGGGGGRENFAITHDRYNMYIYIDTYIGWRNIAEKRDKAACTG